MKAAWRAAVIALGAGLLTGTMIATAGAAAPKWHPLEAPGPVQDSTGYHLNAVDCWAPGDCVAVGDRSSDGTSGAFIDQESNGTWSYVPTTSEAYLQAVSCPAKGACVAVGTIGPYSSFPQGVVEVQSGNTWTEIAATGAEGRYSSYTGTAAGVSCPATNSCAVVGQADSNAEVSTGFVLTLKPGNDPTKPASWTAKKAPEQSGDGPYEDAGLAGVSCVSAGNCRAVGFDHHDSNPADDIPLIDEEKNYVWAYGGSPAPTGTSYGQLRSVSCIKAGTVCMAAGSYQDNGQPFIVTIDTSTDSSEAAAEGLAAPFTSGELSATSCAPDGQCQSVGNAYANSGPNYGWDGFIVSERYGAGTPSGTAAATISPKDANTVQHNETLTATSCVSGGFCVSVGNYLNNSGPQGQNEAAVIDTRTYDKTGAITGETDIKAPEPANDTVDDDQAPLAGVRCNGSTHCVAVGSYFNDTDTSRGVIDTLGTMTAPKPPAVTKVSPAHGSTAGGNTVTITGTDLHGATKVTFGSKSASHLDVVSGTELTVHAPAHGAGQVDVRVTTGGGKSPAVKADHYTYGAKG